MPHVWKKGERLISGGAGIVFKGSGFYETDYKRAGAKAPDGEKAPTSEGKGSPSKDAGDKKKPSAPTDSASDS